MVRGRSTGCPSTASARFTRIRSAFGIGLRTKSKMAREFLARERSVSRLESQLMLPYGRL